MFFDIMALFNKSSARISVLFIIRTCEEKGFTLCGKIIFSVFFNLAQKMGIICLVGSWTRDNYSVNA